MHNRLSNKYTTWARAAMALLIFLCPEYFKAQELDAKIVINSSKVGVTDKSVFENLQQTLEQFVNERQWTELQFQKNERIQCSFNITINKDYHIEVENVEVEAWTDVNEDVTVTDK